VNKEIKQWQNDLSSWTTPPDLTEPKVDQPESTEEPDILPDSQNQPKDPN
jgi:hypothetical protein